VRRGGCRGYHREPRLQHGNPGGGIPGAGPGPAVIKTITVGDRPDGIAASPVTGEIYTANYSGNTVSVISPLTETVIKTIRVGSDPWWIAVSPVTGDVYVVNSEFTVGSGGDSVSVINGWTNTVVKTIPVGHIPEGVAVSPITGDVYVTNSDNNSLSVISGWTNTALPRAERTRHRASRRRPLRRRLTTTP
jgi:YVTN family beta-propeller protein